MTDRATNPLTAHLHAVNESYLQHLGHALSYSARMFAAAFCALVHAIFPFLFEKTASSLIKQMYAEMTARGATKPIDETKVYAAE